MNRALAFIIEDTPVLADLFAEALTAAGYAIEIIEDGQAALERLQKIIPDMILLDLNLPRISGETVLAYVRGDDRFANTRVVIASGNGTRAQQINEKVDLILHKPIEYHQLRRLSVKFHPGYEPPPTAPMW